MSEMKLIVESWRAFVNEAPTRQTPKSRPDPEDVRAKRPRQVDTGKRSTPKGTYTGEDGMLVTDHVSDEDLWSKANEIWNDILDVASVDGAEEYFEMLEKAGVAGAGESVDLDALLGAERMQVVKTYRLGEYLEEYEPDMFSSWEACRDEFLAAFDEPSGWTPNNRGPAIVGQKQPPRPHPNIRVTRLKTGLCGGRCMLLDYAQGTKRESGRASALEQAWNCWSKDKKIHLKNYNGTVFPGDLLYGNDAPDFSIPNVKGEDVEVSLPRKPRPGGDDILVDSPYSDPTPLSLLFYQKKELKRGGGSGRLQSIRKKLELVDQHPGIASAEGAGFFSAHVAIDKDFFREYKLKSWEEFAHLMGHELAHFLLDHKGYTRDALKDMGDEITLVDPETGESRRYDVDDIGMEAIWQANETDADKLGGWLADQAGYAGGNFGSWLKRNVGSGFKKELKLASTHLPSHLRKKNRQKQRKKHREEKRNKKVTSEHALASSEEKTVLSDSKLKITRSQLRQLIFENIKNEIADI